MLAAIAVITVSAAHAAEYRSVVAADGTWIEYTVVLPEDFDPARSYPVMAALPPGGAGPGDGRGRARVLAGRGAAPRLRRGQPGGARGAVVLRRRHRVPLGVPRPPGRALRRRGRQVPSHRDQQRRLQRLPCRHRPARAVPNADGPTWISAGLGRHGATRPAGRPPHHHARGRARYAVGRAYGGDGDPNSAASAPRFTSRSCPARVT